MICFDSLVVCNVTVCVRMNSSRCQVNYKMFLVFVCLFACLFVCLFVCLFFTMENELSKFRRGS